MQSVRSAQLFREYRGIVLFLGLMLLFRSAFADWMTVPTGSMNPTIVEGDRILVNKHAYGWRIPFTMIRVTTGADPQRGEIAVFYSPKNGERLVKRVIGVPGDLVEMRDEVLYINGHAQQLSSNDYLYTLSDRTAEMVHQFFTEQLQVSQNQTHDHAMMILPQVTAMRNFGPIKVTTDHYLMLGDNRDNSADSRYIGLVPRDEFVGRANTVVASLNPDNWYLPRGDRFWKALD